ncbi:hypothetical protein [Lactococcus sp.]|uniref:hypothetical protein n=1 Tax=Lactococcus sp. TaxID=44273 RepID=UPI002FC85240
MAVWAFPFVSANGDRAYGPADWMQFYANIFSTGIVPNTGLPGYTGFQVVQTDTPSLNINVGSGVAIIKGGQIMNTAPKSFQIPAPLTSQSRTDSLVVQWNNSSRSGDVVYKTNSTQVTQTADVYELQIATIVVPANASSIAQSNITDTRADTKVCGYSSPYESIKTGDLLAQFKSELEANGVVFSDWFEHIKGQLSEDAAGNLQNEIDNLTSIKADNDKVVHNTGDEDIAGKKNFVDDTSFKNITVSGVITQPYISTSFAIGYGLSVTAKRVGNLVTITFKGSNTTQLGSGANPTEMIPLGYRPVEAESVDCLVQGRHLDTYYYFNTDGKINYMGETVPVNSYFRGVRSYFTNDPWPVAA